jgi:hypothetical protein
MRYLLYGKVKLSLYSVGPDPDRAGHLCEKQHGHESQRLLVAPLPPPGAFPLFSFLQKIATSFVFFFSFLPSTKFPATQFLKFLLMVDFL